MGNIRSKEGMKGQVNLNYVDPVQVEPKITSKEHDVSDSNLLTKPVVNRTSNRLRKVPARINDVFLWGTVHKFWLKIQRLLIKMS